MDLSTLLKEDFSWLYVLHAHKKPVVRELARINKIELRGHFNSKDKLGAQAVEHTLWSGTISLFHFGPLHMIRDYEDGWEGEVVELNRGYWILDATSQWHEPFFFSKERKIKERAARGSNPGRADTWRIVRTTGNETALNRFTTDSAIWLCLLATHYWSQSHSLGILRSHFTTMTTVQKIKVCLHPFVLTMSFLIPHRKSKMRWFQSSTL